MSYVFDFKDALWSEEMQTLASPSLIELENNFFMKMLEPIPGGSLLDIGCGIGSRLKFFLSFKNQLSLSGLDPSPYMLDIAGRHLQNQVDLHRGTAEDLPFDDNSFDYACLINSLEYVEEPREALMEACRVAKDRLLIVVINRYSYWAVQLRCAGIFSPGVYNRASFFSILELHALIRSILGKVPICWRTILQLPVTNNSILTRLEQNNLIQRSPFGALIGMTVSLEPRFRTRPLKLRYPKSILVPT